MRQFVAALTRADQGVPQVMVIEGNPGVGVTRLLAEFAKTGAALGWQVIDASTFEPNLEPNVAPHQLPRLLIADDAHLLSDETLETLRTMITSAELGSPFGSAAAPPDVGAPNMIVIAIRFTTRTAAVGVRRAAESVGAPTLNLRPFSQSDALLYATDRLGRHPTAEELALLDDALGFPGRIDQLATSNSEPPSGSSRGVPLSLTPFIGRREEIQELRRLLATERLVTITGAGGSGKTRLAQQTALGHPFPHHVVWVELARRADEPGALNALCSALGVNDFEPSRLADGILHALANRPNTLLVLDNADHLLVPISGIVRRILSDVTGVRVLCTSREPLDVGGELLWHVPPLSAPPAEQLLDVESLRQFESVQLFLERASRVRRGFALNPSNITHVQQICSRLDGLPLAIELTAARVRTMPAERIASELGHRMTRESGFGPSADDRHETLYSCIAWSEELLENSERVLFRRLGVFVGGFTLDAAQAVGASFGDIDPYAVAELIRRLVDKSLLALDVTEDRFLMLETIRTFALHRLDQTGETERAQAAHVDRYARWLESLQQSAHADDAQAFIDLTPGWLQTIHSDIGNCCAAFGWVVPGSAASLRLAAGLGYYWLLTASYDDAERYGAAALAAGDPNSPEWIAATAWMCGVLNNIGDDSWTQFVHELRNRSDLTPAARVRISGSGHHFGLGQKGPSDDLLAEYHELRRESEALKDWFTFTNSSYVPASVCAEFGLIDKAESLIGGFLNHRVLLVRANCALWRGQLAEAADFAMSAEALVERDLLSSLVEVAEVGYILAQIHLASGLPSTTGSQIESRLRGRSLGTFDETLRFFEACESLRIDDAEAAARSCEKSLGSNAPIYRAYGQFWLARIYLGMGRIDEAQQCAMALLAEWAHLVAPAFEATAHLVLAECSYALDTREGLGSAHRSLAAAAEFGLATAVVDALEGIGAMLVTNHRVVEGARLLGATQTERNRMGYHFRFPHRRRYVEASQVVAMPTIGWAEGCVLSLAGAVELAQRMRGERKRASFGWDSLTPTEEHVVQLVVAGHSNPQIAERLFVSRATVKTHLVHIYDKLGINSRSELAVRAATRTG